MVDMTSVTSTSCRPELQRSTSMVDHSNGHICILFKQKSLHIASTGHPTLEAAEDQAGWRARERNVFLSRQIMALFKHSSIKCYLTVGYHKLTLVTKGKRVHE